MEQDITLRKVDHLLKKGDKVIARIEAFLQLLRVDSRPGSNQIRKLTWLENFPAINRLRRALKNNMACIYTLLILKHMYVIL